MPFLVMSLLVSAFWPAAGDPSERILLIARDIGLTGLFFLAGARLDVREAWKTRQIALAAVLAGLGLLIASSLLLGLFTALDRYVVVVTAAAITASSLWLPGELSQRDVSRKGGGRRDARAPGARSTLFHTRKPEKSFTGAASTGVSFPAFPAAALTAVSMVTVHLFAAFQEVGRRGASSWAYGIVALYELIKVAIFFFLACLIAAKFIDRAAARVSRMRTAIGFLLIAILVFALAVSVVGWLWALGWSFVAGALFARIEPRKKLGARISPVAAGLLLLLTFVPIFLQTHGRTLSNAPALIALILAALAGKFFIVRLSARAAGASRMDARLIAASTLSPGEAAIMFLSFAVTRWVIEAPEFFGILVFAVLSMIAGPLAWRFFTRDRSVAETGKPISPVESGPDGEVAVANARGGKRRLGKKASLLVALIVAALGVVDSTARAQSVDKPADDDPVSRAIKSIESSADERARAAEVVLAAARLVNESRAAKKRGERDRAARALEEAATIATQNQEFHRSALIEELTRLIAAEQTALRPNEVWDPGALSSATTLSGLLPRAVLERFGGYRGTLGQILIEEKVPVELLAVAMVESGFSPQALSPKGARGIWQFMPATARRYGLAVEPDDDQRTHPEQSTRAAARYLRDLYTQFRDWGLALAAYNAGENRIQRIIDRTGIRTFDEMARRGYLPAETRKYVPAVLELWRRLSVRGSSRM